MRKQNITTQITPFHLSEKDALAMKWQTLETRANNTVFLSWLWISHWLDLVTGKVFVVECYDAKKLVGLACFVENTRKAFGFIPVKQWFLHRTGNESEDQIWIEYNDFLLDSAVEVKARSSMIKAVCDYDASVKEFIVGLSSKDILSNFQQSFAHSRELISTKGYSVDFDKIQHVYLTEVLSKNSRAQIKRSEKLLTQEGELSFSVSLNKEEISQLLGDIAEIHINRWQNTLEGSGFTNPLFSHFHQSLINDDCNNVVQVATLSLNNRAIGYLFNFVYQEHVYFYLSALTVFENNKIKVGLTLHAKAIQFYQEQGLSCYDFLGGEARYKSSLSNQHYNLAILSFFNNSIILQVENKLKAIKQSLKLWLSTFID